jgi:uncharacterized RDD family membrane protein YckC
MEPSPRNAKLDDMPSADEFWEVAARVASERGGLVVGFAKDSEQPGLGCALDNVLGFSPLAPVTVISLSDWRDWKEQVEVFYRLRPSWGRGKGGVPDANYYRVKFDELGAPLGSIATAAMGKNSPLSSRDTLSFSGYAVPLSGLQGVPFWPRVLARVIDFLVHYLSTFAAGFLFVLLLAAATGGRPPAWVLHRLSQTRLAGFVAAILGLFAYHVICTSVHGSTLGKMLLSMQVIEDDGSPCRPKSAIFRELAYFVDAMFFGVIGYFAMREDPEQKRLGDGWADTIVCKRARVPSTGQQPGMRFVLGLLLGIIADIALVMTGWLIQMNS